MHPKQTVEQNLDLMAGAMSTLTGRVSELQQQMAYVQQEKLNSFWANLEALTQVGAGKNNFNSPGMQLHVHPTRPDPILSP